MKRILVHDSGIFNPRILGALLLCLIGGSLGSLGFASTSTLTPTSTATPKLLSPAVSPPDPAGLCSNPSAITPVITLPSGQAVRCPAQIGQATLSSSQLPQSCVVPGVNDWCPAWSSAPYDGPGHKSDSPGNALSTRVMGTSLDGKLVFLAGTSDQDPSSNATNYQVVTIAYEAAKGNVIWTAPYTAPSGLQSYAQSLAVGGSRVFVTMIQSSQSQYSTVTMAYDASTGVPLWPAAVKFAGGSGSASTMATSPDGARVYVTGYAVALLPGGGYRVDGTTIAYDGATGNQLWVASVQGPAGSPPPGFASGFGVAAVGSKVFMAAAQLNSQGYIKELDLLVVDACTGQSLATGSRAVYADDQAGFAVSPDGSRAFMEFQDLIYDSSGNLQKAIMGVAGFDAQTGQSLWVSDYFGPNANGPLPGGSIPWMWGPIAVSPDGSRVFAATESSDGNFGTAGAGFTTVAYDAATGAQLWASAYNTNTPFIYIFTGPVVSVDPTGRLVYTTGPASQAETFATIAYDAATGAATKTAVYTDGFGSANAQAVSPDGSRVFVGAVSSSSVNTSTNSFNSDIVALAYDTGVGTPVPAPVQLSRVVSRKVHGSAGTFDVDLTSGNGIECRSGGANGDYTLAFTFTNSLTSISGASVTSGNGSIASSHIDCNDAHSYIVNVTGVANAQHIRVSLNNVSDSGHNFSSAVSTSMGVLVGDTNGDGFVNSADISQTKSQSGTAVTSANFREDVNTDGFLNSADISLVKSKSGTALP